ncbi:MAG: FCD domain-containing protein [Vallitaleaceae bacterium]|jgi:GntR family transcriptional repressor for pyruvate dehydrogenase complex|nr:FCD domain-containing protein [Vallitaleaceae bacterium]
MTRKAYDSALAPVGGKSVVDVVIRRIVEAISDGTYRKGQKLPNEYELINELQISRNSLREAMRVLATVGVVEIKRGDGTYVCEQLNPSVFDSMIFGLVFDASSSAELIELRQSLDEIMLKLAIDKADEKDIEDLAGYIEAMERHFKNGELDAAASADFNFHLRLLEAGQNKLLTRIVKGIYQFFKNTIHINITTEEQYAQATEYHRQILDLLISRDKAGIENVVSNSLKNWRDDDEK